MVNVLAGESCDDANLDATDACTTLCLPAECGDGFTYASMEACDDGNADDTDMCMSWCEAATCADGLRNAQETDVDCGATCGACTHGHGCQSDGDCFSGTCSAGRCVATTLVAGGAHTCALLEGGAVRCWGYNWNGQLGYGHMNAIGDDEAPASVGTVQVGGGVAQLAAGG